MRAIESLFRGNFSGTWLLQISQISFSTKLWQITQQRTSKKKQPGCVISAVSSGKVRNWVATITLHLY